MFFHKDGQQNSRAARRRDADHQADLQDVTRHQKGTRSRPGHSKSGASRRDLAVLIIAVLRARGIAGLFVSGDPHLADDDDVRYRRQHPRPGFRLMFPFQGGSISIRREAAWIKKNLIRVAVAQDPREVIPLQGTWFGTARRHPAMKSR